MYQYHSNVTSGHPYESSWYSWLINWIPLIDSRTAIGTNTSVVETYEIARILLVFYFVMLTPWMLITRTVFIYQYFICTQVLILMICHSIMCMDFKKEDKILRVVCGISISLFIMFFPVISGMEVSRAYVDQILKWLPKWWF